jgi:hypothetical protein
MHRIAVESSQAISVGEYRSREPIHGADEKWQINKKTSEKALIPLPPTGLVSFFCANSDVVQTKLQATAVVGFCGRSAISFCARFYKQM